MLQCTHHPPQALRCDRALSHPCLSRGCGVTARLPRLLSCLSKKEKMSPASAGLAVLAYQEFVSQVQEIVLR